MDERILGIQKAFLECTGPVKYQICILHQEFLECTVYIVDIECMDP